MLTSYLLMIECARFKGAADGRKRHATAMPRRPNGLPRHAAILAAPRRGDPNTNRGYRAPGGARGGGPKDCYTTPVRPARCAVADSHQRGTCSLPVFSGDPTVPADADCPIERFAGAGRRGELRKE